jgi:hypothetical protein
MTAKLVGNLICSPKKTSGYKVTLKLYDSVNHFFGNDRLDMSDGGIYVGQAEVEASPCRQHQQLKEVEHSRVFDF